MRLTHIKLAGFKSFVEPTHIPTPGKRVGIVGPNGCGKSNVIDAVRWVLGESSARQLRGESMMDVIFNGSTTRRPVSRASVELTFDNSLGRAAGAWSQYAELAVKRVLQRDGESHYFVNNQRVRRKDVTDIFLGTGLGPRAYAIIEQGMISRIIEARPEDMRVFLEEAAGVSKYKERRRETELRLRDTRDNLSRLDDVRLELEKQLTRLESQAAVAARYHALNKELQDARHLRVLLQRRDAAALREKCQRDVQRLATEMEAETARLRQLESRLEEARQAHYGASDALHAAQAALYEANAEVARIEEGLKHQRESRARLAGQINALAAQQEQQARSKQETEASLAHWRMELESARLLVEEARENARRQSESLPAMEDAHKAAQARVETLRAELAQAEQSLAIEEANLGHARKARQQMEARIARLEQEKQGLAQPDEAFMEELREDIAAAEMLVEETRAAQAKTQAALPAAEQARKEAYRAVQANGQHGARLEARLQALQQMQGRAERDQKLGDWLARHGLDGLPRLWERLQAEAGWEKALESVLGARLDGLLLAAEDAAACLDEPPPARLVLAIDGEPAAAPGAPAHWVPLAWRVTWDGQGAERHPAFLRAWLRGIYLADGAAAAWAARARLGADEVLVCPEGHVFGRDSVEFYAEQSALQGVLARKREIEALRGELSATEEEASRLAAAQGMAEDAVTRMEADLQGFRGVVGEQQQKLHRLQLELHRHEQQAAHMGQRREQIARELAELAEQVAAEAERMAESEYHLERLRAQVDALQEQEDASLEALRMAEEALDGQRDAVRQSERAAQETLFHEKSCASKIAELETRGQTIASGLDGMRATIEDLRLELETLDEAPAQEGLQRALSQREAREGALAAARDAMNAAGEVLRAVEEARMKCEQGLNPLRERLNDARLKEQEARLTEEQLAASLRAENADEAALGAALEARRVGVPALEAEIERLAADIAALGAVNLAALEELERERERKAYLDEQGRDLGEAVETLESAIRRIDRETRDVLQATYDAVNQHLGELFPALFGGGQARLVLSGEEILDAGIQIIAQPPGKKNSTIHLLSGGEKALTALSLVFAIFRLNPAPFCLLDEVDAPLDDANTGRFCELVRQMSAHTQFLFISHNKITMELADQLVGITMQEQGVSRMVAVDIEEALKLRDSAEA